MNKYILCIYLIMSALLLEAQITVTAQTLPVAGDTLHTVFDGMPMGISISSPGGNQQWDFRSLQGVGRELVMLPASEGTYAADFPSANMVTTNQAGEAYLLNNGSSLVLVGVAGVPPGGPFTQEISASYSPPSVQRRAPMNFFDDNTNNTSLQLAAAADDLPLGGILDSLPISPDSLRLRIVSNRDDLVDAWGELQIPGKTYQVLREKRVEISETRLDVKIGGLPWQDFTDFLPGLDFLGADTIKTYHFYSNDAKEAIALLTVNPQTDEVISVEYKTEDISTAVPYVDKGRADVFAYPNPAIDVVRFDFMNLKPGSYKLKVYNILGTVVWENSYPTYRDKTVKVDLTDLKKGTYLYSLVDEHGKTITTKRLMIIRP